MNLHKLFLRAKTTVACEFEGDWSKKESEELLKFLEKEDLMGEDLYEPPPYFNYWTFFKDKTYVIGTRFTWSQFNIGGTLEKLKKGLIHYYRGEYRKEI